VREKFAAQSATPSRIVTDKFDQFLSSEIDRYAELVKTSGAKQSGQ